MARVIERTPKEYKIGCGNCDVLIAYVKNDVKVLWGDGFREPVVKKSWIICPACNKKVKING